MLLIGGGYILTDGKYLVWLVVVVFVSLCLSVAVPCPLWGLSRHVMWLDARAWEGEGGNTWPWNWRHRATPGLGGDWARQCASPVSLCFAHRQFFKRKF